MYDNLVISLNEKLKTVTTYEEFSVLEKEVEDNGFALYSKRSLKSIFHITHMFEDGGVFKNPYAGLERSKNRVHYLFDDGTSQGKAYIENLYKYFEIR